MMYILQHNWILPKVQLHLTSAGPYANYLHLAPDR